MRKFILIFFAFSITTFAQVSVNPTRPSASDNAFTTAEGYSEIEFGFSSIKNNWTLPLLLKIGMLQNLEFGFSMNGLLNSVTKTETGNPGLQLKYRFYNKGRLSIAFAGKTEFVKSSDPAYTFYAVPSIVAEAFQVDATFGVIIADDGFGYNSSFIHAVALSPNIDDKFGMFAEIFGEMTTNYNPIYLDGGISYKLSDSFVIDGSLTYGLNDDAGKDITIQIGFTSLIFKLF
jgi:hypothetical protein